MPDRSNKTLTATEAAQIIYRTSSPSSDQILRVYQHMRSGALRVVDDGLPPEQWTTTELWLAELLASHSIRKQQAHTSEYEAFLRGTLKNSPPGERRQSSKENDSIQLNEFYREYLRDYFLAVLWRRRTAGHSQAFKRAVTAGQVVMLTIIVAGLFSAYWMSPSFVAPERRAVERWIDENADAYEIIAWHPTTRPSHGGGVVVRVEYVYYKGGQSPIHADKRFQVLGNSVWELFSEP